MSVSVCIKTHRIAQDIASSASVDAKVDDNPTTTAESGVPSQVMAPFRSSSFLKPNTEALIEPTQQYLSDWYQAVDMAYGPAASVNHASHSAPESAPATPDALPEAVQQSELSWLNSLSSFGDIYTDPGCNHTYGDPQPFSTQPSAAQEIFTGAASFDNVCYSCFSHLCNCDFPITTTPSISTPATAGKRGLDAEDAGLGEQSRAARARLTLEGDFSNRAKPSETVNFGADMNFLGDTEIAGTKEEHDHAVVSRRRIKKPLHRLAPNPPVMPMSSLIASLNNSAPALGSTPALQAAVGVIGLPLNASTYGNEPDFREETSENSFMLTHAMSHGMPQTSSLSQLHATRACEPVAPSLNLEPALGPHASYVSDTSLGINTGFDRDANLAPNAGYGINHGLTTYNTQASSMRISHSNPASYPMPALPHNLPTNIGLATVDPTLQLDEPVDASYTAAQGYTGPLSNAADMLAVSAFSSTPSSLVYRGYPIPGSDALFQAPIQPTVRSPAMALSHLARPAFTQDVAQPATTQTDGAKIFNRTKKIQEVSRKEAELRGKLDRHGQPRQPKGGVKKTMAGKHVLPPPGVAFSKREFIRFFANALSNPDAFFWLVSNGETQFTIAADFNFSRDLTEKTGGVKANTLTKTGSVVAKTMSARFGEQKRNMAEIKKRDEGLPQAQKWLRSDVRNTADHWQRTSNTAHDVRLRDLGAGVIHFPTGNDRGIITQCIQFAKQTQDDSLMLSQVLQVAAQQGFVSPFPVRRGVSTVNQVI